MKTTRAVCAALAATLVSYSILAGPRVLEEHARVALPDPSYTLIRVTVDGSSLLALGIREVNDPDRPTVSAEWGAFLFERASNGSWPFVRELAHAELDPTLDTNDYMSVSMRNGVAAIMPGFVFEKTSTGWVRSPYTGGADGVDVKVGPGMILASAGYCGYDAVLHQKLATGVWTETRRFLGQPKADGCDSEFRGAAVDLTSNRVIVDAPGEVHIWQGSGSGQWDNVATAIVPKPVGAVDSRGAVAIEGDDVVLSGTPPTGSALLRGSGGWHSAGHFWRADSLTAGSTEGPAPGAGLELRNGLAAVGYFNDPFRGLSSGTTSVFQRDTDGHYAHVAQLVASNATSGSLFGRDVDLSGRRVAVISSNSAYVYDLPTDLSQPQIVQDNFEDGNSAEWTALAGSTFSVVPSGTSLAYRQSSIAGDAAATRTGIDWTHQAIEAIVTPRTFSSTTGEKWFGLTVRQSNPSNYYYVTVRNTNVVQLRKLQNGVITILASATMPVTLGTSYRLRLEAVGTWIRGYVDGKRVVEARDTLHTHGTAGVRMYKTAADFDDVMITPNPQITLYGTDFEAPNDDPWTYHQGTWPQVSDGTQVLRQTSLTGDARATIGLPTDDQVIQVRAKANTFAAGGERWFGVMSRFRDEQNFYYLTVRNTNQVSLRKLVGGTIFVLDTATLPVSTGNWYSLRLETIGNALRGYVNGRLLVDATDTTHTTGTYGLATFKTNTSFDDLSVTQP